MRLAGEILLWAAIVVGGTVCSVLAVIGLAHVVVPVYYEWRWIRRQRRRT